MSDGITEQPTARSDALEYRYDLTVEDVVALAMHLFDRGGTVPGVLMPSRLLMRLAGLVLLVTFVGACLSWQWPDLEPHRTLLVLVVFQALLTWGYLVMDINGGLRRLDRRRAERHVRAVQEKRLAYGDLRPMLGVVLRLDAEGFTEVTAWDGGEPDFRQADRKETFVAWRRVRRVTTTNAHVFLWVGGKGYLIVPRSAFAEEADLQTFLDAVAAWRRTSDGAAPRPADTRITGG
jgi:hypothetical protein